MGQENDRAVDSSARAEAAVWVARLHADDRSKKDEAAFLEWLESDSRHQEAFAAVTEAWTVAGGLKSRREEWRQPVRKRSRSAVSAAAALVCILLVTGFWWVSRPPVYATMPMEQRRLVLADGSAVVLDANSAIRVSMGSEKRVISLEQGRAHFDVAKDPARPFVVKAGDESVQAIGTAFDVTSVQDEVAVTLIEGKLKVAAAGRAMNVPAVMKAGDRLVFRPDGDVIADRPDIRRLTAWSSGRLVFHNEPLASAVVEINRYGPKRIVLEDDAVKALKISGVYEVGSSEAFARSVTELLPVSLSVAAHSISIKSGVSVEN